MTQMLKSLAAITLSVIMALTLFPLVGGGSFTQTAFADDEIVQDDGAAGSGDVVDEVGNEEEPAVEEESPAADKVGQNKGPGSQNGDTYGPEIWPAEELYGLFKGSTVTMEIGGYSDEYTLEVKVGTGFNDWDDWEYLFTEGNHYTYDSYNQWVTLDGTKIWNKLGGPGFITVSAAFVDSNNTVFSHEEYDIEVKEAVEEYNLMWDMWRYEPSEGSGYWTDGYLSDEYETVIFPNEKFKLYEDIDTYIENADNPWGGYVSDITVNNVEITGDVLTAAKKSYGWLITANGVGEATVKVNFYDMGGTLQEREFQVRVANERLWMSEAWINGNSQVVAGESVKAKTYAYYESDKNPYDTEGITYSWWIDPADEEYAEVAEENTEKAANRIILKKKALNTPYRYIKFWVEATYTTEEGTTLSARTNNNDLFLCRDLYRITPTPDEIGNINIGEKRSITPELYRFYFEEGDSDTQKELINDATFKLKYLDSTFTKKNGKKVYSWKLKDKGNGEWEIERLKGSANELRITAKSSDLGETIQEFYPFDKIRTSLSSYRIRIEGAIQKYGDNIFFINDSNEGISPKIEVYDDWYSDDGYVLPEDEYKLVIQKKNDFWFDSKWKTASLPFQFNRTEDPYEWGSGAAIYRVYAVSNGKHGFTKNTPKDDAWVFVYSEKTLSGDAGSVKLNPHYDQYKCTDENDINYGYRYNLPVNKATGLNESSFFVAACGGNTPIGMLDFMVEYQDYYDYEAPLLEQLPDKPGMYWVVVKGQRSYYGQNDYTLLVVGEPNPISVTKKTVTVKASKLKKAKQKAKPLTKVEAFGELSYDLYGNKKLSINKKTGQVTVKKGTKKGTYKARVEISTKGDETYAPEYKYVTITIKVK